MARAQRKERFFDCAGQRVRKSERGSDSACFAQNDKVRVASGPLGGRVEAHLSLRIRQGLRVELQESAEREWCKLGNVGAVPLEWGVEQFSYIQA